MHLWQYLVRLVRSKQRLWNLPTELMREVGRVICYLPWQKERVREIENSLLTGTDLYHSLYARAVWLTMTGQGSFLIERMNLPPTAPRRLSINYLARSLVLMVTLARGIGQDHLVKCLGCRLFLLAIMERFLRSAAQESRFCYFYSPANPEKLAELSENYCTRRQKDPIDKMLDLTRPPLETVESARN